jgi:hypothetical protein|tara:strand:+ start:1123 stop:1608 length:486 start_codon:yes stop_codon:yes gene_type:complete
MKDKIQEKIDSKDWKFHELLKLPDVSKQVAEELYHELDLDSQLEMIWEIQIPELEYSFGSLFKILVMQQLEEEIMVVFKKKFESATVNFSEKSTPSIPAEKPASLIEKPKGSLQLSKQELAVGKDTMEELMKGKDALEEYDLKEKDGKVSTRAGNVKVERV